MSQKAKFALESLEEISPNKRKCYTFTLATAIRKAVLSRKARKSKENQ